MKLLSVEKKEKSTYELRIEVDKETFGKAVDEAFAKNLGKISVPGFRKGHAPRKIVEKMYGEGVFYEDAINATCQQAYDDAVKESGLDVVATGTLDIEKVDADGYIMIAIVPVRPEVKLGDYKNLEIEEQDYKVTDEMVDQEINRKRELQSRFVSVDDRAAEKGDFLTIDFDGFVDGERFKGGKSEDYELEIGSGTFINGFEDQLIGKNLNDEVEVNVTFPEDYHEKSLAGKPALFKVKIKEIKYKELPELNDDFAKDASEFDTFEEFKADTRKKLEERAEENSKRAMEQEAIDKLVEGMEAEIPDAMVNQQIENTFRDYNSNLAQQGLDINTYLKLVGQDEKSFRESLREGAEKSVKGRVALEEVAKLEKFVISEEEIEDEFKRMSDMYEIPVEQIRTYFPKESLEQDLAVEKAVKFITSNAKVKKSKKKDKE